MSGQQLTQPKLNGKWVFLVLSVLAALSILLLATQGLIRFWIDLDPLDFEFSSSLEWIFEGGLDYFVSYYVSGVCACFIDRFELVLLAVVPTLFVMQYIVYGYKLRVGVWMLPLAMLLIPLRFWAECISIVYSLNPVDLSFADLEWTQYLGGALALVGSVCCVAAALALVLIPKVGRFVSALLVLVGTATLTVGNSFVNHWLWNDLIDYARINSGYMEGVFLPILPLMLTALLMAALLLTNKGFCVFEKRGVQ